MTFFYDNGWVDFKGTTEANSFRWAGEPLPHYLYAVEEGYDAYGIDGLEFA